MSENQEFAHDNVKYITRLERQRRRYMDDHLRAYKLFGSMFSMILFLDRQPGSSQDDLCSYLGIDKSNVARKCRHMEDQGYIRREQSQEDRRQNRLFLTESGRELLPVIRGLLVKWSGIVTEGLDSRDQKELLRLLGHMMENSVKYANMPKA